MLTNQALQAAAPMALRSIGAQALLLRKFANFAPTSSVSDFIHQNLDEVRYDGDSSFLAGATPRTKKMWETVHELLVKEHDNNGVLSIDTSVPSSINAFPPGYITGDPKDEIIHGLQTTKPLERAIKPLGGWRMVDQALEAYGQHFPPHLKDIFVNYRKTHNAGVFDVYTDEMKKARNQGILTGLPDAYSRGRIIGDYRRVALFGVDELIKNKKRDKRELGPVMDEKTMRLREEVSEQIRALGELKKLGESYGFDLSRPAETAKEAIQWLYMGYLASVREHDGAAMSLGKIDGFLEPYFERDMEKGLITEEDAQEMIDDLVIKLRIVRHLRPPAYNALFAGDPTWVTAVLGGVAKDGKHMVTKTSFRILNTLNNLGPAPEPNLTVLWNQDLPEPFKQFCAETSINTSSIQYENDSLMSKHFGDDYGIACCVSGMEIGKAMQFFGARFNGPKLLLYALNGGRDEISGELMVEGIEPIPDGPLQYDEVMSRFQKAQDWLAQLYSSTMNCIHYSHDKYFYERIQMALHDTHVTRMMAYGVAGLSVVADSLSAIKFAEVTPVRDPETGLIKTFDTKGDFPKYGNDDDRVDGLAVDFIRSVMNKLRAQPTYRESIPTMSVLTITSNVVYGNATGDTPDGRVKGQPYGPGANPLHGRDEHGAIASLTSVSKIPYEDCLDGISNTFSILPATLGKGKDERINNLVGLLNGYFSRGDVAGHHLNVNVLDRETLLDAMDHPEKYPQLTIRVSGYAVHFTRLSREQQLDVIHRTFHESI